jgi:hypothetical protein
LALLKNLNIGWLTNLIYLKLKLRPKAELDLISKERATAGVNVGGYREPALWIRS